MDNESLLMMSNSLHSSPWRGMITGMSLICFAHLIFIDLDY